MTLWKLHGSLLQGANCGHEHYFMFHEHYFLVLGLDSEVSWSGRMYKGGILGNTGKS